MRTTKAAPPKKLDSGWIKELRVPGGYWTFSVFNDGNRLVVTDSKPYKRMPVDSPRPALVPRAEGDRAAITRTETVRVPSDVKPATTSGAMRPGAAAAIGGNAEVAPAADFPMFVAANSGKIVFLADMNGGGWNDYVRERALSLSVDDSGILNYADPTQFLTRENRLGGPPQRIDMRVPIIDFKFDSTGGILAVSSQENCLVRMNDIGGGGVTYGGFVSPRFVTTDKFNRIYVADPEADQVIRIDDMTGKGKKVLQFKRDTSSAEALNKPGSLAGPAAIFVLRPAQGAGRIR